MPELFAEKDSRNHVANNLFFTLAMFAITKNEVLLGGENNCP